MNVFLIVLSIRVRTRCMRVWAEGTGSWFSCGSSLCETCSIVQLVRYHGCVTYIRMTWWWIGWRQGWTVLMKWCSPWGSPWFRALSASLIELQLVDFHQGVCGGPVVSMLDCQSSWFGVQIPARAEILIEISAPPATPSQLNYDEYWVHCPYTVIGKMRRLGRTGHPTSYAEAKKMKSLTLHPVAALRLA